MDDCLTKCSRIQERTKRKEEAEDSTSPYIPTSHEKDREDGTSEGESETNRKHYYKPGMGALIRIRKKMQPFKSEGKGTHIDQCKGGNWGWAIDIISQTMPMPDSHHPMKKRTAAEMAEGRRQKTSVLGTSGKRKTTTRKNPLRKNC